MRRQRRRARLPLTLAALAVTALTAGVAQAWWQGDGGVTPAAVLRGAVSFAAEEQVNPTRQYATGTGAQAAQGSPVTVTVPGSVIATILDGQPVVWRFDVVGYAQGIAGLTYDLSYDLPDDGTPFTIDTVLEGSRVQVYPATPAGDCVAVPQALPQAVQGLITIPDQVLQAPGTNPTGADVEQVWCVLMDWNSDPSQLHTNVATATATDETGSELSASSLFESYIDYLPSLNPLGSHTDTATAEGAGLNGAIARDTDSWRALLYPDPNLEPDLTITLTPRVTVVTPSAPA